MTISATHQRHNKWCGTCTIGYICNGIDRAIDGGVLLVNDESEHGQESGVDEGDAEADDADWKHEDEEVAGEGDEEAGDALQHEADQGQGPLKREAVKMWTLNSGNCGFENR